MVSRAVLNGWPIAPGSQLVTPGAGGGVLPALPALPLAAGTQIWGHGDSQIGNEVMSGAADIVIDTDLAAHSTAYGPMEYAIAADPRVGHDVWYNPNGAWGRKIDGVNQGIHGDHMGPWAWPTPGDTEIKGTGILPRADFTVSKVGSFVDIEAGTNSLASGDVAGTSTPATSAYVIAQLDALLVRFRAAGWWVRLRTIYPRSDFNATQETRRGEMNTWIKAQAGRDGVAAVIDCDPVLLSGGVINASMFLTEAAQNIHLNQRGAQAVGELLKVSNQALFQAGSTFIQDPSNANNLFASAVGALSLGLGTKTGGEVTGSVAGQSAADAKCVVVNSRGKSTVVASKDDTGVVRKQILTITPVNDTTNGNSVFDSYHTTDFRLPELLAGSSALRAAMPVGGEWVQGFMFAEIGDTDIFSHVQLNLTANNGARSGGAAVTRTRGQWASGIANTGRLRVAGNRSFWLRTKKMQLPTATWDRLLLDAQVSYDSAAGSTGIIKLSAPIIYKVADPRVALGFPAT